MTIHILNQYVWPDNAPTSVLAEQLAGCLARHNYKVSLVGGSGTYRPGNRPQPSVQIVKLPTEQGKRGGILSSLAEYHSVNRAFAKYIRAEVQANDIVICTSAPPNTIHLIGAIGQRRARAIYWLQDFYPDLLRGFIRYPHFVRSMLSAYWGLQLRRWHKVVKISSNLDYWGRNASVLRNWPTARLGAPRPFEPKTAWYFGNLGYGHSLELFVAACTKLRDDGYAVTVIGDGPKVTQLPPWITVLKPVDGEALQELLWRAEIHLVAADPEITGALFPSKYWTSRSTGRKIVTSGFAGPMLLELKAVEALAELPSPEDWLPFIKTL